jgi:hypothetical protein
MYIPIECSRGNYHIEQLSQTQLVRVMANTRKVLLSLHTEVADHLDQEPNKSAVVDALAAAHYGLNFEGGSTASSKRQTLLDKIKAASTEVAPAPLPEPMAAPVEAEPMRVPAFVAGPAEENVITTTTTETVPAEVELASSVNEFETVAPPGGDAQPEAAFVPVAPDTGFVPQVEPLEAAEPEEVAPVVEPVQPAVEAITEEVAPTEAAPEPEIVDPLVPTEPPVAVDNLPTEPENVSVQVEPGTSLDPNSGEPICPTCKSPMLTPVCLNCL